MKALLMWKDHLMNVYEVERMTPEIKIPVVKAFNILTMEDQNVPISDSTSRVMVFRYADGGRGNYLVYDFYSIE